MRAMARPERRLSQPIYEALPWLYMLCGVLALMASYAWSSSTALSVLLGLAGLLALIGGMVVALRRRNYREMKANKLLSPDDTSTLRKLDD